MRLLAPDKAKYKKNSFHELFMKPCGHYSSAFDCTGDDVDRHKYIGFLLLMLTGLEKFCINSGIVHCDVETNSVCPSTGGQFFVTTTSSKNEDDVRVLTIKTRSALIAIRTGNLLYLFDKSKPLRSCFKDCHGHNPEYPHPMICGTCCNFYPTIDGYGASSTSGMMVPTFMVTQSK
ncbi:hypothetical protein PCE1_004909 [Barthelona sp. PCE]